MKHLYSILRMIGTGLLLVILILVTWQPVLPSVWIIKKMAAQIDPASVPFDHPVAVRFELSGKGGGLYNIVASPGRVSVVKGPADRADLILYMEARDFNHLMFALARGKADEGTFRSLILSKVLRFAGDMSVFERLFSKKGARK